MMACPEKVKVRSTDIRNAIINGDDFANLSTKSVTNILQDGGLYKTM